jgi:hypothetical protein
MNDNVTVEARQPSIPPEVVWGIMVRIVEIDKLLRTGSNIAEVRRPVRKLLNAAATELSSVLMPELDDMMAEVGILPEKTSRTSGAP